VKRQSSFPLFITKNGNQIPQFFFFLLCGRKEFPKEGELTRFKGNCHYLCAPSEPTLGKAERHPPYKDKHDKGDNTSCLIALDKETKSKAKGDFYKKYTTTRQQQGTRARHLPYRSGRKHQEQGRSNEDNNASRHKNLHQQKRTSSCYIQRG